MFLGRMIWPLVESRVVSIGKTPVRLWHKPANLFPIKTTSLLGPPLPTQARPTARIFGFNMVRMSPLIANVRSQILDPHHRANSPRQNEPSSSLKTLNPPPYPPSPRRAIIHRSGGGTL